MPNQGRGGDEMDSIINLWQSEARVHFSAKHLFTFLKISEKKDPELTVHMEKYCQGIPKQVNLTSANT